jgi:hypothetical protein
MISSTVRSSAIGGTGWLLKLTEASAELVDLGPLT